MQRRRVVIVRNRQQRVLMSLDERPCLFGEHSLVSRRPKQSRHSCVSAPPSDKGTLTSFTEEFIPRFQPAKIVVAGRRIDSTELLPELSCCLM